MKAISFYILSISAVAVNFASCRENDSIHSPAEGATPILNSVTPDNPASGHEPALSQKPQSTSAPSNRVTEEVRNGAKAIAALRAKRHVIEAAEEIHKLLEIWSPKGLTTDDIVQLFGPPTSMTNSALIYLFDDGYAACEWIFVIKDGVTVEAKMGGER